MQNRNKITTLFLDIGGVLLSDGWGREFRSVRLKNLIWILNIN